MLDFTKTSKRRLDINLIDGKSVCVRMPTKRVFDALLQLQERMAGLSVTGIDQITDVYNMVAQILSNNLANEKLTPEYLEDLLDIEDVQVIIAAYMEFVGGIISHPN